MLQRSSLFGQKKQFQAAYLSQKVVFAAFLSQCEYYWPSFPCYSNFWFQVRATPKIQQYLPFEGICFVDTLELAEGQQLPLWVVEENTERIKREKEAEIRVVIGNPPYNVGQVNENDNNKNRRYKVVDQRVKETYVKDSSTTNKNKVYDAYVRFFRWAADRLSSQAGVVCFVTNNSFLDQIPFDGRRKHFLKDFTHIYHLDLYGNIRKKPKLSGSTHNVFGIQVGVGITIAVRLPEAMSQQLFYYRVPELWDKREKLQFLQDTKMMGGIDWQAITPDGNATWITEGLHPEYTDFLPLGSKAAKAGRIAQEDAMVIFQMYGLGVSTNRDEWAYDFEKTRLAEKIQRFLRTYNGELDRWKRRGSDPISINKFVTYDDKSINRVSAI